MSSEHPVKVLCRSFDVSSSGYYDWRQRQTHPSRRVVQDEQLKHEIARLHLESRGTYGAPRIQFELAQAGRRHGRNRIGRLMREQQLCGRQKRRFRVRTTDRQHDEPIAPNRLAERPAPTRPNEVWVADITYVTTAGGWVYVAPILDLFSRRIVGWALSQRNDTALVLAAWQMACTHRQPPAGFGISFRPWRSIRQPGLSPGAGAQPSGCLDESQSQLLRQCARRGVLEHAEAGVGLSK